MKRKRTESNRTERNGTESEKSKENRAKATAKPGENGKEICGNYKRRTHYTILICV